MRTIVQLGGPVVKMGYNEGPLVELLKQILSLNQNSHLTLSHKTGRIEIYFHGDMRRVQEALYKWLDEPERRKWFETKVVTAHSISEVKDL